MIQTDHQYASQLRICRVPSQIEHSCFNSHLYEEKSGGSRVEAGPSTSTVALRVVGEEMGSLQSETVKYGHESQGTRTPK
jgi:hypothetical protein